MSEKAKGRECRVRSRRRELGRETLAGVADRVLEHALRLVLTVEDEVEDGVVEVFGNADE